MTRLLDRLNPYALAMQWRRSAYRAGILNSYHPGIPVISVGNLTMGGSGKTPLTMAIARHLMECGKRVAVVSRGYRRSSEGFVLVQDGTQLLADVSKSGDEAQLIAMRLPGAIVIVDEDRVHGARQARNLGAQVVLLDDGYQHMRIRRDLNILVDDAARGFGQVLPFGTLREPLSAASDADVVISTNADRSSQGLERKLRSFLRAGTPVLRTRIEPTELLPLTQSDSRPLPSLAGVRVLAVSSIAAPQRFYETLRRFGAVVVPHALRDHAAYDLRAIERVRRHADSAATELIVTTEKDGVKSASFFLNGWNGPPVYVLPIEMEFIDGADTFFRMIDSIAEV